jgi:hypothetical protein
VCRNDPRTRNQRRADALEIFSVRGDRLGCLCGAEDCPAGGAVAAPVVIDVLGEAATLTGSANTPGFLPGFGIVPAETMRDLAARAKQATVRCLATGTGPETQTQPATAGTGLRRASGAESFPPTAAHSEPAPSSVAESRYRPSARLAEFIGWRDLTCRFPGCDAPVARCDVDHTAPFPRGATHPSNLKLYCRAHHLLKTFHTRPGGWSDGQLSDGTVVITAPTGHVYTTEPHGGTLFSALAAPTGTAPVALIRTAPRDPEHAMPVRARTRDEGRRQRIADERRRRTELDAERRRQAWLADRAQPPPF